MMDNYQHYINHTSSQDPGLFHLHFDIDSLKLPDLQQLISNTDPAITCYHHGLPERDGRTAVALSWISQGSPVADYVRLGFKLWPLKQWINGLAGFYPIPGTTEPTFS